MKKIILLMMLILLLGCQEEAVDTPIVEEVPEYVYAEPVELIIDDRITLRVDPKIEMVNLLFEFLEDELPYDQYHEVEYINNQEKYFEAYNDHMILDTLKAMAYKGFTYDAVPSVLHHYDDNYQLKENIVIDEAIFDRAGGQELVESFLEELKSFRETCAYDRYFESQKAYYEEVLARAAKHIENSNMSEVFFDYYGESLGDIIIVVTPESTHGYGVSLTFEDETVLMPTLGVFRKEVDYIAFLLHELSHPYVNPLTTASIETVDALSYLFNPIRKQMSRMAYTEWEICVNEHIVRANVIEMMCTIYGDLEKEKLTFKENKNSFIYLDHILASLEKYTSNRETYATFKEFYDTIISDLSTVE